MAPSPCAFWCPCPLLGLEVQTMFPRLPTHLPMSFLIEYSTRPTFGVPQPPFSTKKVPKIKKIKTKSVFERATSIISDKVFRGVVGEVKGRPLHRRNPGRPLYWPRTLSPCLFRDEGKSAGSGYWGFQCRYALSGSTGEIFVIEPGSWDVQSAIARSDEQPQAQAQLELEAMRR